jgi:hypothetical protein
MISPYQNTGMGQYYGPPDGLAYLLAPRNRDNAAAWENLGSFAGAVGAGIGGVMQARRDPALLDQAFGMGRGSPAQAGLMNFAAVYDQAGGGGTGFSAPKADGGGGGGRGVTFKQLAELGKAADATRRALRMAQPKVGDEQPDVFGTDEEWQTLGAREKFGRVQAFVQANAEQAALQKMALVGQQMEAQRQAMEQQKAFGEAMSLAQGRINNAALAEGNGRVRTRAPGLADFAQVAGPAAWAAPQANAFREMAAQGEAAPGMTPGEIHPIPGAPGHSFVALSRGSGTVINTGRGATPDRAPQLFDLPGGRKGFYDTDGSFKTYSTESALPPQVEAQLSTYYAQLGSVLAELGDPNVSAKRRAQLEKDRARYEQQIEQIKKGFGATGGGAAPINPNDPLGLGF